MTARLSIRARLFAIALALVAISPSPVPAESVANLEDLRVTVEGGRVRLFARTSTSIEPRVHWLPQTGRDLFVVDLPGVRLGSASIPRRPGAPLLYAAAAQWRSSPPVARIALHFPKRVAFRRIGDGREFEWILGDTATVVESVPGAPSEATTASTQASALTSTSAEVSAALSSAPPPIPLQPPPPPPDWREKRVTLSFRDARLADVLRVIGEQNDLSILIHPEVTGQISVFFDSVRLEDALRSILSAHGYTFRVERNLVTILPARLDFASYRVWFLKTPGGGTLPELLRDLVPPPSRLFYYRDQNAIVLFAAAPSVADLVESALAQLDREPAGN